MTEEKRPRKPPTRRKEYRPRIDAILRAIREGKFDDELNSISGAIKDRQTKRQESVLKLVHETFGEEYSVVPKPEFAPAIEGRVIRPKAPAVTGPDADQAAPSKAQTEDGWVEIPPTTEDPLPDDGPEIEIESHSPIIGPYNPGD